MLSTETIGIAKQIRLYMSDKMFNIPQLSKNEQKYTKEIDPELIKSIPSHIPIMLNIDGNNVTMGCLQIFYWLRNKNLKSMKISIDSISACKNDETWTKAKTLLLKIIPKITTLDTFEISLRNVEGNMKSYRFTNLKGSLRDKICK